MSSTASAFDRAYGLQQRGKFREALEGYATVLAVEPDHAPALHFSGVALHQSGDHGGAVERIRKSIAIDPASAEPWSNLALALDVLGQREAAINALKEAARRAPQPSPRTKSRPPGSRRSCRRRSDSSTRHARHSRRR